jgi:hypothetical protein
VAGPDGQTARELLSIWKKKLRVGFLFYNKKSSVVRSFLKNILKNIFINEL